MQDNYTLFIAHVDEGNDSDLLGISLIYLLYLCIGSTFDYV